MEKYQVFPGQNYQANVIGFTGLQEVSVIHVYESKKQLKQVLRNYVIF